MAEQQTRFELELNSTPTAILATGELSEVKLFAGEDAEKVDLLGQIYTPDEVASAMAHWVCGARPLQRVLDPAAGSGNLLRAVRKLAPDATLIGIERDEPSFQRALRHAPARAQIIHASYLECDLPTFDGIIANPPYVKAHKLDYSETQWKALDERLGMRFDRLTNLYGIFLIKIWRDLAPGGRAAVILPAEVLSSNFGAPIREKLLQEICPAGLAVFASDVNVFENVLTTSVILFLSKETTPRLPQVRAVRTLTDVVAFERHLSQHADRLAEHAVPLANFRADEKWLNSIYGHGAAHGACRLGDFFRCKRGIATGANDFFCLNAAEIAAQQLDLGDFQPCLTKAADVDRLVFTDEMFECLVKAQRPCYLFDPKPGSALAEAYIKKGEALSLHQRYLTKARSVWYRPEARPPAEILVPVFTRGRPRFTLNATKVKNLTCFHGLYRRPASLVSLPAVALFLNSRLGYESFKAIHRFYGDGLNKVEPKDVEQMACPPFADVRIDEETTLEILRAVDRGGSYHALDQLAEKTFAALMS